MGRGIMNANNTYVWVFDFLVNEARNLIRAEIFCFFWFSFLIFQVYYFWKDEKYHWFFPQLS